MTVDNRRTDTRERILAVALRMFATKGYANSSLREIADELGVTKAALYFHFKTKEDILNGILLGHLEHINGLVDDATEHATTLAGRQDFLRRLAEYQAARSVHLVRLIRENFTEIACLPLGTEIKNGQRRLFEALAGPDATLIDRIRARTAFIAIQSAAISTEWEEADQQDVMAAALTVALEVLGGPDAPAGAPGDETHSR
ncbi:TetR/AcrR family transcriptional regulator [Actinoplanes sp. L3-i22]|uniref:TetR/AcrR family transcriptional regulator n=1 Tax=Actinoplanes sp. L3-i22 TaxID=2836373 RepID=UPI001C755365|nr:TetR/AcrR family transcriptional regulator [Actinoplanes sp. L3-i22]BCY10002.1 TetR family transcriptional regulator [Actinoplanes sp. L3-i22]